MKNLQNNNPFAVQTPEDIPAKEVTELFEDVFTDFYHVPRQGHTFINGPRGTGKSMMFRFMLPDCQQIHLNKHIPEHEYFAVYVPIKKTILDVIDLKRLQQHANIILNEHLMVTYVAVKVFETFKKSIQDINGTELKALKELYNKEFVFALQMAGWDSPLPTTDSLNTCEAVFVQMQKICDLLFLVVSKYVKQIAFRSDIVPYNGPLCGYLDFLFPLLEKLKQLPFMPKKPIYLLIDDADNLNLIQTSILNTWVSYRTSAVVSLKISTQLNYKTYRTVAQTTIDSPHDYSEVNIGTAYTSSKDKYKERITAIVEKRLKNAGISKKANEFFPENEEQEKKINEKYVKIKEEFDTKGRGFKASDDAYRYARPDYIKSLKGKSKSGYTYSYSGFKQLVDVSSGIIRYFLEAASLMYSEVQSAKPSESVMFIDHAVQDKVIRKYSDDFLLSELDKLSKDEEYIKNSLVESTSKSLSVNLEGKDLTNVEKLRNLIEALGGMFSVILLSNASERRVFSVALSDRPDNELAEVLKLGVRYGYLQESSIGNKEGTGRTKLYILSRRLAPSFTLDPTSFAGYKFITSASLKTALSRPQRFIRTIEQKLKKDPDYEFDSQLNLFKSQ